MAEKDDKEKYNNLHTLYYANLARKLREGKSLTDKEFKHLREMISDGQKDIPQSGASGTEDDAEEKEVGVPESLKFKRHYTMTDKAREQRKKAAKGSKVNNWKHGKSAKSFLNRLKPCHKTCEHYPCEVVAQGGTKPGGVCLDKAAVISNYQTLIKAVEKKDYTDFNELAALTIAESIHTMHLLLEDIMRDGTVLKRMKYDKDGNNIGYEIVAHPSLLTLPKMIADLGITPSEMMITPKALAKKGDEDEGIRTIADLMSSIGKKMKDNKDREA
jgi:hypothetical protein